MSNPRTTESARLAQVARGLESTDSQTRVRDVRRAGLRAHP
jgi:hypothetical protein